MKRAITRPSAALPSRNIPGCRTASCRTWPVQILRCCPRADAPPVRRHHRRASMHSWQASKLRRIELLRRLPRWRRQCPRSDPRRRACRSRFSACRSSRKRCFKSGLRRRAPEVLVLSVDSVMAAHSLVEISSSLRNFNRAATRRFRFGSRHGANNTAHEPLTAKSRNLPARLPRLRMLQSHALHHWFIGTGVLPERPETCERIDTRLLRITS